LVYFHALQSLAFSGYKNVITSICLRSKFLRRFYYTNKAITNGIKNETNTALKIIAIELRDPSNSPLSSALDIPIPCEAAPIPTPRPMCVFQPNNLYIYLLIITPPTPATLTNTAANEIIPPKPSVISTATGVVTDFGAIE